MFPSFQKGLIPLALLLASAWGADTQPSSDSLILDGGFEQVEELSVGQHRHVYQMIQDGADLGGPGPVVRLPSNFSQGGVKVLHVVEGTPGREVHAGRRAIRLTGSFYVRMSGAGSRYAPRVGDVFRARFYARGRGYARLILSVIGPAGRQVSQVVPPPFPLNTDAWTLVEHRLDTRDQADMKGIAPRLEASGDIVIDDLELVPVEQAESSETTALPIAFAWRTDKPVQIDGRLEEPCWHRATRHGPFWQHNYNTQVSQPLTFFRVAFDDRYVYFAVEAMEPVPANLTAEQVERDAWPPGASIELFLDTRFDRSTYYQLAANLAGSRYDARGTDRSWNTDWQVAVHAAGDRWTMEVAIPLAGLEGGVPEPGALWGLNVCRNRPGGLALSSTWARVGGNFHAPGRFNTLIFGTIPEWYQRQTRRIREADAAIAARLDRLSPRDADLDRKLAAARRRLGQLTPPASSVTPQSPEFMALYDQVRSTGEDFQAVADESEAAAAIQSARRPAH